MPDVLENGSKLLKINEETYNRMDRMQKCAFMLDMDFYVFSEVIYQLISQKDVYNPLNVISGILVGELNEASLIDAINKFLDNPRELSRMDRMITYATDNGVYSFYFIPNFDPSRINDEYGFTIDQVFYKVKSNELIDTTGRGLKDFTSLPIIIKSTSSTDRWTEQTLLMFVYKIGILYDSEIDEDDFRALQEKDFKKPPNLHLLLRLNRPGTSIKVLMSLCPQASIWLFDMVIRLVGQWGVKLKENIRPSQVFTDEKLKLLDLYSDYFNSSGSPSEKRNRDRIIAKLLVDI